MAKRYYVFAACLGKERYRGSSTGYAKAVQEGGGLAMVARSEMGIEACIDRTSNFCHV